MADNWLYPFLQSWLPLWLSAAGLAVGGALALLWLAPHLLWFDHPTHRSSHDRPTPTGGGIGMVAACLLYALLFWSDKGWGWLLFAAGSGLALTGWRDDWQPLPPARRLFVQLLALCAGLGAVAWALADRGVSPWQEWPWMATLLAAVGVLLAGVWWINLFNFMDGLDGFAAQEAAFLAAAAAGHTLAVAPDVIADPWWGWATVIAAAAAGFLVVNWPPARIFMGDVASTFLPWALFLWALYWVVQQVLPLATALLLPLPFVVDATVTLVVRWRQGARLTEAHCSHCYQQLARFWGGTAAGKIGHRRVNQALFLGNLLIVAPAAWGVGKLPLAQGLLTVALVYGVAAFLAWRAGAGRSEPTDGLPLLPR